NIQFLQNIGFQRYLNLFQTYIKTIKVFQKETTLNNALKHKANELNNKILNENQSFVKGIILEQQDKLLTPDCTQALIVKYNKSVQKIYQMSKTINQLKLKILTLTMKDQKSESNSKEQLDEIVEEVIKNAEIGLAIL
ncbi:20016_t:CDS:1, partial [Dentiscutata erythropus]